jgi:Ca-activated chloride channel family protein
LAWLFCFAAQCTAKSKIQTGVDEDISCARRFGKYERKLEWTNKVPDCCCSTFKSYRLIEQKNSNVEFAVRVFGYQFPREQKNCTDSKLLVPFSKQASTKIKTFVPSIAPKGMSPIAYSLQQCANDFPEGGNSLNAIILVTDGNENCDGNICLAVEELAKKHIALKPFIVGLSMDENSGKQYNCAGQFYNSADEASLYKTVGVIIKQTLNTTTAQVNLLNANGRSISNQYSIYAIRPLHGKVLYNYVHTLSAKEMPDTLFLDPVSVYDLVLHTTPSIAKK